MCGFTGRAQACVTLHPSHSQTALPTPPQRGYSEREDEKAGTKQAALDGEPFGGGQLATIHLHPSEEQQGQEGGKRQRRACTHHWSGGEKRRRVRPSPPCRSRRQIQQVREFESPVTSKPSGDCSHPPQAPTRRGDPPGIPHLWTPRTLPPRGNAHRLEPRTRQLCGQRTRKAGPPNSDPPLVRPGCGGTGDPVGPVTHHALPWVQRALLSRRRAEPGDGWLCACVRP